LTKQLENNKLMSIDKTQVEAVACRKEVTEKLQLVVM